MRIDIRETGSAPYVDYMVLDADTGFMISAVVACDDEEGWVLVHRHDYLSMQPSFNGDTKKFELEKFHRPIRVVRKDSMGPAQRWGVLFLAMAY